MPATMTRDEMICETIATALRADREQGWTRAQIVDLLADSGWYADAEDASDEASYYIHECERARSIREDVDSGRYFGV